MATEISVNVNDEARMAIGESASVQVYQFCGLLWATEYNAHRASLAKSTEAQTVNAINTLLTAFAALEALATETALCTLPALYADENFRLAGLPKKFKCLLKAAGRTGENVPDIVTEISKHRIALTHSEPDNSRSTKIGTVTSATDAARFARGVRDVAEWLWQGKRSSGVAHGFDNANVYMRAC